MKQIRELLLLLAVSAATAMACSVTAQTIPLTNATATFSQTISADLSVAYAIDDRPDTGWAIGTAGSTKSETAVFESVQDIQFGGGVEFVFRLNCGAFAGFQFNNIGRFRLSVTSDDRSEFADALATGGDVTANWEVLEPLVFCLPVGPHSPNLRTTRSWPAASTRLIRRLTLFWPGVN